jgi:5-formyltetrahydrofolate cyclo-ligase
LHDPLNDPMALSKAEVRATALAKRDAVADEVRAAFAARLAALGPRLVLDHAPEGETLVVSLFSAMGSEPDLSALAEALASAGVPLALPVTGPRGTPLTFRRWSPGAPLTRGKLGIAEPPETAPAVEPDLLFVPLAAFDRRGQRIGYGQGYYDRTLRKLRALKRIRAIGIGYSVQEQLFIPEEQHDEPLDLIVTERTTLLCES